MFFVVLHQSCTFSAMLTVPLQTKGSKWPPRRRMHSSARALKLTLARLQNAQCTCRENDTNEVCDGILQLRNVLGTFFIDFELHTAPEKRSLERRAEVR